MALDHLPADHSDVSLGLRHVGVTLDRIALKLPALGTRREQQCRRALDLVRQSLAIVGCLSRGSDARQLADQHARSSAEFLRWIDGQ